MVSKEVPQIILGTNLKRGLQVSLALVFGFVTLGGGSVESTDSQSQKIDSSQWRATLCQPFQDVVNFDANYGDVGYPYDYHPDAFWRAYIEGMKNIPEDGIQPTWVVDTGNVEGHTRNGTVYCES